MAELENTTPLIDNPGGENNIPSKDVKTDGENEFKINEIIEKQMEAFKNTFMAQFNEEYSHKLDKLKSDNLELEEKKQRFAVSEELRIEGLDGDWIDFAYNKDFEISKMKITQLKGLIDKEVQKGVLNRLRAGSYVPPEDHGGDFTPSKDKPQYFL
ncbi:hypothetical protein GCM10008908_39430 [Clostridium subterminale]|uniref:Uncharacterized protein n=1 Tax=Clostridium subterminale TaxID=1550 RepID=A0ABN1KZS4_CLOSU